MNPNYNQTITIYNCLRAADNPEERKDVWQRTILHDCFYKNVMGKAESGNGLKMENVCTARIHASESYMPYRDWAALPEQERRSRFTCGLRDIVVKGECMEEITGISPHTAAFHTPLFQGPSIKIPGSAKARAKRYLIMQTKCITFQMPRLFP